MSIHTGAINNAVNVPSLDKETRKKMAPLLYLAQKLGRFQSLYIEGRPSAIEIEYCGEMEMTDTFPITSSILMGFLEPKVESVNMVSAPSLLNDFGISLTETRTPDDADFGFQMRVTVTTDTEKTTVGGTLTALLIAPFYRAGQHCDYAPPRGFHRRSAIKRGD